MGRKRHPREKPLLIFVLLLATLFFLNGCTDSLAFGPNADFEVEVDPKKSPLSVVFDATDSEPGSENHIIQTYKWDFGDGTTNQGEYVVKVHEYSEPGTYDVSLTIITDAGRSDTYTKKVTVKEPSDQSPAGDEKQQAETTQRQGKSFTVCSQECDFDSIQRAINSAKDGDFIEIKTGTYTENIELDTSITLHGKGPSKVTINSSKDDTPVVLIGPSESDVNIENLTISGAKGGCSDSTTGLCVVAISLTGNTNATVTNCNIKNNAGGIRLMDNANVVVKDSLFLENNEYGINLWGSSTARIVKTKVLGTEETFSEGGYGIMVNGKSEVLVNDCKVSGHSNGLDVENNATAIIDNCTFSKNENGIVLRNTAELEVNSSDITNNTTGIWTSNAMVKGSFKGDISGINNSFGNNSTQERGYPSYRNLLRQNTSDNGESRDSQENTENRNESIEDVSPIDMMATVFRGYYSKTQIERAVHETMRKYNLPLTERYEEKIGSVLVKLRKEYGVKEMRILECVNEADLTDFGDAEFHEAAALCVVYIRSG